MEAGVVTTEEVSDKNAWLYWFLLVFAGGLGVHKFYLNRTGAGILYLLTGGILGVGVLFDWLQLVFVPISDKEGRILSGASSLKIFALISFVVAIIGWIFIIIGFFGLAASEM